MPISKEILVNTLLKTKTSLTTEEIELLKNNISVRKIKRRQFILQEGMVCQHYNFIIDGCFKMYSIDTKGSEYNMEFGIERDWIVDIESFYSKMPSSLFIEAVEPSTILQINRRDLMSLFDICPKFERIFRMIIEDKFVLLQKRVLQNISSTVEERYVSFLKQYPALSRKLPNTQIASYLGVTPEFLCKIRRNVVSR